MRTPFVAGNWKMNTTLPEATELIQAMKDKLDAIKDAEKAVCPPFISLAAASDLLKGTSVKVGAQNMYYQEKGAYTGEVSPLMLQGLCDYVILGHSERRQYFGETDESVNKKVQAALQAGLIPIICVGENLEQNEAGQTRQVVIRQTRGALEGIKAPAEGFIIAYEPVWAIGTGKAATGESANHTISIIRQEVAGLFGSRIAEATRILYGGSVTGANIAEFARQSDIDGGLVGGASLKADDFVSIVQQTAGAKRG